MTVKRRSHPIARRGVGSDRSWPLLTFRAWPSCRRDDRRTDNDYVTDNSTTVAPAVAQSSSGNAAFGRATYDGNGR